MATRWARFARGWTAAIVATLVSALFHLAAGGEAPGVPGVLLALALSGMACVLLAGRRLSLWRLTLSVALSQVLFHAMFGLGAQTAAMPAGMPGPMPAGAMMQQHGMLAAGPWMWACHAAAAALTVAVLRHGERQFCSLRSRVCLRVSRCLSVPSPVPLDIACGTPLSTRDTVRAGLGVLVERMRRRGPPAPVAL